MGKQYELSHLATNAKTGAGRRAIEKRHPKIVEDPKSLLALRGHATSAIGVSVLSDLCALKKPLCRKLRRKNEILPFEAGGEVHLENLARLNDCSLFALTNHTKKRPHNIIFGRTFGFRILDMFEFGITNYVPMASFPPAKSFVGSKPMVVFNGADFDATASTRSLRSVLLDVFRGPHDVETLDLAGLGHIIVLTLRGDSEILFRNYSVKLLSAEDSTLPQVVLDEIGPRFELELRRMQLASPSLMKEATRKPKDPKVIRSVKNVSRDELGDKKGRIHVGRQDLSSLALAKMKGLDKKRGHTATEHPGSEEPKDVGSDNRFGSDIEVGGIELADDKLRSQTISKRRKTQS